MSLLSQGLGRFGFGNVVNNASPHPADNAIIVIVIIGGIHYDSFYITIIITTTIRIII